MDSPEKAARTDNTDGPWLLNGTDPLDVERYLLSRGVLASDATPIAVARAGAGNMNLALRVTTRDGRSFILKQGRPWVEKYAHIPAPFERTIVEAAFYAAVQPVPDVARHMPSVLHVDARNHVLLLEDIGAAGDFTSIYDDGVVPNATVAALLDWLHHLSRVSVPVDQRAVFSNREMRALNHEHIFDFPLRDANGLDLDGITAGLADEARQLATDRGYAGAVAALGSRYLSDGATLVHGDYFPGSWLKAAGGPRVIDPEFCFLGDPEFDYGVLAAHVMIAQCRPDVIQSVAAAVAERRLDRLLVAAYAGVEIMRRLIGVAQLPLTFGIDRKQALLRLSRRLVVEPQRGLES
jgi:5-methylthioribose kinase